MNTNACTTLLLTAAISTLFVGSSSAAERDPSSLVRAVTVDGITRHLDVFQRIANRYDGNRAAGTPGFEGSVRYVSGQLEKAGYKVKVQPFSIDLFEELSPPRMVQQSPGRRVYEAGKDFATMDYSGAGDVVAELVLAGGIEIPPPKTPGSRSGCAPSHFAAARGKIALVQRGTCTFEQKAENAAKAGAVGVIIFNEGQPGRRAVLTGTLGAPQKLPVVGTSYNAGRRLYQLAQSSTVRMRLKVDALTRKIETSTVIAEWTGPLDSRAVVVGAHLDSVPAGPGINDNGSGSAAILEIALQMKRLDMAPRNTVRFAFWGAEEQGLYGSTYYVGKLTANERRRIMANLNFDMLASPNFVRFVYDGDGTIGPKGPPGSDAIEGIFDRYFAEAELPTEPTLFDGRSDYFPFIEAGIPAGGLFSGAEEIKTKAQAKVFGGKAGKPLDACYHEACDDISNISKAALNQLGRAAADAVATLALTKDDIRPSGEMAAESVAESVAAAATAEFRGPQRVR